MAGAFVELARRTIPPIAISALLCLAAAAPVYGLDPNRQITQFGHIASRVNEGVFRAAPTALAQTADGYIWVGTQAGLMRFDGVRFVGWIPPDDQPLPSQMVTARRPNPDISACKRCGTAPPISARRSVSSAPLRERK